jgi:hypothetical protein
MVFCERMTIKNLKLQGEGKRAIWGIKGTTETFIEVYIIYLIRRCLYVSFSDRLSSNLRFQLADLKPNIAC